MKKLFALAVFLFALPLYGQATITNDYTAGQVTRITRAMNRVNAATCKYRGLPASCTTTQVREQFCKTNGFGGQPIIVDGVQTGTTPLVSDCNGATQFIVYGNITQFDKRTLLEKIDEWAKQDDADDKAAAAAAWAAKTQAQKDAICTSLGLPAGCTAF